LIAGFDTASLSCLLKPNTNRSRCISKVDVIVSLRTLIAKRNDRFQLVIRKLSKPSIRTTRFRQVKCDALAYNICLDRIFQLRILVSPEHLPGFQMVLQNFTSINGLTGDFCPDFWAVRNCGLAMRDGENTPPFFPCD
jgi:hypothetical protein